MQRVKEQKMALEVQGQTMDDKMLNTIASLPTEIVVIELASLQTDEDYQRNLARHRIEHMLREFSMSLFGVPIVNERRNGSMWVVDGQHRAEVLRRRGEKFMRVERFHGMSKEQEAWLFNKLNSERSTPNPSTRFKARLVSGEMKVEAIRNIVASCGFRLAFSRSILDGHIILAVTVLEEIYDRIGPKGLTHVLQFIANTWNYDPDATRSIFIGGAGEFLRRHPEISLEEATKKLRLVPASRLIQQANGWKSQLGGDAHVFLAKALLDSYNAGRRTRRVDFRWGSKETPR